MDMYNFVNNFTYNVFTNIKEVKIRKNRKHLRNQKLINDIKEIEDEIKMIDNKLEGVDSIIESTDIKTQFEFLNKELTTLNASILETNKKGKADKIAAGVNELNQTLRNVLDATYKNQDMKNKKEIIMKMREDAEERLRRAKFSKIAHYDEPVLGIDLAAVSIMSKTTMLNLPNFLTQYEVFNNDQVFSKVLESEINTKRSLKNSPSIKAVLDFINI